MSNQEQDTEVQLDLVDQEAEEVNQALNDFIEQETTTEPKTDGENDALEDHLKDLTLDGAKEIVSMGAGAVLFAAGMVYKVDIGMPEQSVNELADGVAPVILKYCSNGQVHPWVKKMLTYTPEITALFACGGFLFSIKQLAALRKYEQIQLAKKQQNAQAEAHGN